MSYINRRGKDVAWRKRVINSLAADALLYGKIETSQSMARCLTKLLAKLID